MTTEEKAELVAIATKRLAQYRKMQEHINSDVRPRGGIDFQYEPSIALMEIALAALTAEPVAHLYQWAAYITCEGPQSFSEKIEREAPPDWALEEGRAKSHQPLYSSPPDPTIPEGWRLVPIDPTKEMLESVDIGPKTYKALLAAAPPHDSVGRVEGLGFLRYVNGS